MYGATFDALNIFELNVQWNSKPTASFKLATWLPVAEFDSNFPCGPSRGCIPQPGITSPDQYLDILSYRQRPTYRLAYRASKDYETMVAAQSVEAAPALAGMRWYEIRRANGAYSLYQRGTVNPGDGIHRWMGSVAMDKKGNIAMGYSVSNATTVYPGIRYTGRLAGDPLGQMTLGEGIIISGTGVQTTTNSRWGDYTSLNVDPVDDCTFWYVNEYYAVSGLPLPLPPPPLPPPGTTAPGGRGSQPSSCPAAARPGGTDGGRCRARPGPAPPIQGTAERDHEVLILVVILLPGALIAGVMGHRERRNAPGSPSFPSSRQA